MTDIKPTVCASVEMSDRIGCLAAHLVDGDPYLKPYEPIIRRRLQRIVDTEQRLTCGRMSLADFASGHEFFGLHFRNGHWVLREWAPSATQVYLVGEWSGWRESSRFSLEPLANSDGVWEIHLPADQLQHADLYRLRIHWPGGQGDRIPAYARRVVQDPDTKIFNAQVWQPSPAYPWRYPQFQAQSEAPLIYEVHVGMAQDAEKIGTFPEFRDKVLPRIVSSGYNTIQLMAIQEHPYYGSFGYQVSNFFAVSSRFGTPEDLKALVDEAHASGIRVIMDIVHSHAVLNEVEGLSRFDGTYYQYFHDGPRGYHYLWDSRCFDYGKFQVLHLLLSNCRFWLDEYRFDGFRLDGITSMLYHHHGMNKAFLTYADYFDDSVDEEALTYLALANRLTHEVRPDAITIAEDVSGMPGLAAAFDKGGFGFDYRFAMGVADMWVRTIKEIRDEDWNIGRFWHELTNRRVDEKTISYAECHDQALVGDQSIIFRLIGADMYDHMQMADANLRVDRGMALHKMIRLITLSTAASGYLNFMGNEFGHPEWIDFPREGNQWSYQYARRQWHLVDNAGLKYRLLARFDQDMIALAKHFCLLECPGPFKLYEHTDDKILIFERAALLFAFNFHPSRSYPDFRFDAPQGTYRMILNSDDVQYGGHARLVPHQEHVASLQNESGGKRHVLSLYLPTRTAVVLQRADHQYLKS
jgi:1,4-alpha-glucan branching enzyme